MLKKPLQQMSVGGFFLLVLLLQELINSVSRFAEETPAANVSGRLVLIGSIMARVDQSRL